MKFHAVVLIILMATGFYACKSNNVKPSTQVSADTFPPLQTNPYTSADQSPMDMSYFPSGYPLKKMKGADSTGVLARVIYSRPHKNNRAIFGDTDKSLVRYGREWRLGANEATEIEFFRDVKINGKGLSKGRYVIYCIPEPGTWTIVFNTNLYTWGLHMDESKDVMKTEIPTQLVAAPVDDFTMVFMPAEHGADLIMAWDTVKAVLPIAFL